MECLVNSLNKILLKYNFAESNNDEINVKFNGRIATSLCVTLVCVLIYIGSDIFFRIVSQTYR